MTTQWTLPFNPCPPRKKLIVGVSGGADSMALLSLLLEKIPRAAKKMVVAHVNYGLRGKDSNRDELLVRRFCEARHLTFKSLRLDHFKARAQKEKRSLQDLAREVRYAFFQKLVRDQGAWGAAVAHHREDQAETILDRLLRGAGPRGLSGLKGVQSLGFRKGFPALKVWRPLLLYSKAQLREGLESRRIPWREDGSNRQKDYRRNQIRHQVIPFLEKWNPNLVETLARIGEIAAAEDQFIGDSLQPLGKKMKSRRVGRTYFCRADEFQKCPQALQRRWVRWTAEKLTDKARGLPFERVEEVLRLWKGTERGPRDLGFGLKAGRKQNQAFLSWNGLG